jgi:hypothetical protein
MPQLERYLGIDYSGAETLNSSPKGLILYAARPAQMSAEIYPPPSPRKYWTRRGLAEWLAVPRAAAANLLAAPKAHPKNSH